MNENTNVRELSDKDLEQVVGGTSVSSSSNGTGNTITVVSEYVGETEKNLRRF
jgi:bacteriocin-like protein